MKKFCGCNSKWLCSYPNDYSSGQVTGTGRQIRKSIGRCTECLYCYWNDAWYENMMVDLKSMNAQ